MSLILAWTACSAMAGSVPAPYELAAWQGFRTAAVSYTFDDSCANQFAVAIPMFNQKGLKLTLFSCTGVMFAGWPNLQAAAAAGHEIASHTVTHANLATLSESGQIAELSNSQNAIDANVTTQTCVTVAYPYCAGGSDAITAQYYIAARNCSGLINSSSPLNFMQISSFICGSQGTIQTLPNFITTANNAAAANGWCVYLIHGINNDGGYSPLQSAVLQASVDYYSTNASLFWVQTFGNVARYIKERNDATLIETGSAADQFTLQLTDTLSDAIYNFPVTLRRPVPADWPWAAVMQNGATVNSQITTNNSQRFVQFDAVPDAGEIVIYSTSPGAQVEVSLPATATEGAGVLAGQGVVRFIPAPTNDLVMSLSSSDTSEVTVPSTLAISAGQTNAIFDITIVDDAALDGNQTVSITALVSGYGSAQASITVADNDTAQLFLTIPAVATEGDYILPNAGLVSLTTPVAADIRVFLTSTNTSELAVPASVIIPNGQTSALFNLTIVDDARIDGAQTAAVTAHVPNWTDGFAAMTVLDNEGPPDHFAWGAIPSPQILGKPFQVTLTAQDAQNNTLDFYLTTGFSALAPAATPSSNTFLGSPAHQQSFLDGEEYVLGYSFTPSTNLTVTHVRHYFGDKVEIWTEAGLLIASQGVSGIPGAWTETPLSIPVVLVANATYRIGVHENNVDYFWSEDLPGTFAHGTIHQSYWDYGDAFPNQADDVRWYFVDLRYAPGAQSIPISPIQSGNFDSGTWSGNVIVLEPAANMILCANNGSAQGGQSAPFDVVEAPRLAITQIGDSIALSWPAGMAGFNLEQTHSLSDSDWTPILDGIVIVDGHCVLTNPVTATNTFYRLKK